MKDIKRFLSYLSRYKTYISLNIGFNLLYVFTSFFSVALIVPFVSFMFGMTKGVGSAKPEHFALDADTLLQYAYYYLGRLQEDRGVLPALIVLALVFILVSFLSNLCRYFALYYLSYVRSGILRDLRQLFYRHVLYLPMGYFSEQRKGDLISRMNVDVGDVEWAIARSLQSAVMEPLYVLFFVGVLFTINPWLTLVVLVAFPAVLYIIGKIGKSLRSRAGKAQAMLGGLVSLVEESIQGLRVIKSYNLIGYVGKQFESFNSKYVRSLNGVYRRRDLAGPLAEFLLVAVTMGVMWFGGNHVLSGNMDADMFVLFVMLLIKIISPIKHTVDAFYNIQKGRAALGRIYEVMDTPATELPSTESDRHGLGVETEKEKAETLVSGIQVRDLSFRYPDSETDVLHGISLDIEKGKTYALVGPSGSGKTTFVDLLCRFYEPVSGQILIDGTDIRKMSLHHLRSLMGSVSQYPFVWHDTVYNNICFGQENVPLEKVEEAARKANAHEFISQMENGYETVLGDGGMTVSGGQRQRIVIARAILKNAPILILDEATSALDTESEVVVQQALNVLMQGRTSIVIAHRLSTIRHADCIVVFDKGRIVEKGTHDELLALDGYYARYIRLQSL